VDYELAFSGDVANYPNKSSIIIYPCCGGRGVKKSNKLFQSEKFSIKSPKKGLQRGVEGAISALSVSNDLD